MEQARPVLASDDEIAAVVHSVDQPRDLREQLMRERRRLIEIGEGLDEAALRAEAAEVAADALAAERAERDQAETDSGRL